MSRRVRILLRGVPPLLRRVLDEAAALQPGIELVEEGSAPSATDGKPSVEVVLAVTPDPHQNGIARALLTASHARRVALVTPAGRELVLYDLASRPISAVDLSTPELLDVVSRGVPAR